MFRATLRPVTAILVILLCIPSCSGRERQARNLLLQATWIIQRGEMVELVDHLNGLIEEYPETDAAEAARAMLREALTGCNDQAATKLREAFACATIFFIDEPYGVIDTDQLVAIGYEAVPDVIIEIESGRAAGFRMTARHVAGDLIHVIDLEGNLTSQSMEERK
jgi:hypothetical protein